MKPTNKVIVRYLRIKKKFNSFIYNDIEESVYFEKFEKFMKNYYIMISPTFQDYMNGNIPIKRIIISIIIKFISILVIMKYIISAIINKPWIWSVLSDGNYLLGNQRLLSIDVAFGNVLTFILIEGVFHYFELNQRLYIFSLLNDIKNETNNPYLKFKYRLKFSIHLKIIAKYCLNIVYPNILLTFAIFFGSTIVAYFDPNMNFSIISITFWGICTFIWLVCFHSIPIGHSVHCYLSTLYLKYQFKQINEQIQESLRTGNISLLMNAILIHNSVTQMTVKLNKMLKYFIFFLYFFAKPLLNLFIYLAQTSQLTSMFAKSVFIFISIFFISFNLTVICVTEL